MKILYWQRAITVWAAFWATQLAKDTCAELPGTFAHILH